MKDNKLPATLCIFEDKRFHYFFPLSLNCPVFDLSIGTQTLRGRIVDAKGPEQLVLLCRPYLAEILAEQEELTGTNRPFLVNKAFDAETLFLNGRLLSFGEDLEELLGELEENSVIQKNGIAVAARLSSDKSKIFLEYLSGFLSEENIVRALQEIKEASSDSTEKRGGNSGKVEEDTDLANWAAENGIALKETGVRLLSYYWQLIGENGKCIIDDFQKNPLRGTAPEAELFKGVDVINEEDIVIGSEVEVRSGTVLDASEGPIIIANGVRIEPNAIIYGPCFIGVGSIIRGGAKIGHGTSLGKECRVGGEVEETIIASYTNKQHEGFLGHSYIGSWVNIGAGSCNSDLKNNYNHVKSWSAGRIKDTGRRFLGVVIGDHSKVAINTRFNTGTVVGFNANVMVAGFTPKLVPSFTWATEPEFEEYDLKKAIGTAEVMMDRRNIKFTPALEQLFKVLFRFCRQSGHTV